MGLEFHFGGDENVIELDDGEVCTHCECAKCHSIFTFEKGEFYGYVNVMD